MVLFLNSERSILEHFRKQSTVFTSAKYCGLLRNKLRSAFPTKQRRRSLGSGSRNNWSSGHCRQNALTSSFGKALCRFLGNSHLSRGEKRLEGPHHRRVSSFLRMRGPLFSRQPALTARGRECFRPAVGSNEPRAAIWLWMTEPISHKGWQP